MIVSEIPARTAHARILLVEDSDSNRYVVSTWLRRAGYDVLEAATGAEGLRLISQFPVDLAILDINLPDMTGYSICEQIKSDMRTHDVPVLHVSSTATQASDRSEGLRRGAEGYLVEPVEPEVLLATVEALLRGAAAQRQAARLALRLRQLNESTLALSEAGDLDDLFDVIARQAAILFESPALSVVAFDGSGRVTLARPHGELQTRPCALVTVAAVQRLAAWQMRLEPGVLDGLIETPADCAHYLATVMDDGENHYGTLLIEMQNERQAAPEDVALLSQYARAASTALRNLNSYDIERRIALTLQRNLLPDAAPAIAGLDIAASYAASETHAEVGGDFYEIFALGDDRVVVAIGDVVGHSLEAAAVMAQLRTGIRCYALEGHAPAAILERLNKLLFKFHSEVTATACCLIYDRLTGHCEIANAGHLPPLHASAASSALSFVPLGGTLLGVEPFHVPVRRITLAQDDLLVLFTDGLVERSGEPIDVGLARLAAALGDRSGPADLLCERLLKHVAPADLVDDIAIIALRRLGAGTRA
ncbi:MAG TPA: SpoIIE family protein phosphatase [Candidatus Baltobacteraceae bacterium]|nr:SpoIIE family protein phosphatase [Candidatus Baltobacteraceae bacterium]